MQYVCTSLPHPGTSQVRTFQGLHASAAVDRRAGDERRLPDERRLSRVPTEPSRDEDRRRLRGFGGGGFGAKKFVLYR